MFRFRFSGGYPFHGSPYWCCVWAAVKAQCGKMCWGSLVLNLGLYVDVLICLLTAVGLIPGDSNTVHIYTQTVHRTTQLICEVCRPGQARPGQARPRLCELYRGICLTAEEKGR